MQPNPACPRVRGSDLAPRGLFRLTRSLRERRTGFTGHYAAFMSDLAVFLELVHTAPSRWETVTATGAYSMDLGAARAGAANAFGVAVLNFPPPPGMSAMPTGTEQRPFRVSARGREFVRVEQTGERHTIAILRPDGTATCDDSGEWSFEAAADDSQILRGRTPIRFSGPVGGAQSFGMITMLDPSSLLGTYRFTSVSPTELNERSALQSTGRRQKTSSPFGLGADGLHPATTRVDVTVDRETGLLLAFVEHNDSGPVSSRTLHIEAINELLDETHFAMPADIESTKSMRGRDRFDDPASLASSVNFRIYALDPAPAGTTLLCMRDSASSATITYLTGFQSLVSGRLVQPFSVTSKRPNGNEPEPPGDSWERIDELNAPAWIWSFENGEQLRSDVRISFGDADVGLSGEFSRAEALRLARSLRGV